MSVKSVLIRNILTLRKLREGAAEYKEILHYYTDHVLNDSRYRELDLPASYEKRTLERDIHLLRDVFGVDVVHSRSMGGYHIASEESRDVAGRLLESMDLLNALQLADRLVPHVYPEKAHGETGDKIARLSRAIEGRRVVHFQQ